MSIEFEELIKKFQKINSMGYVESAVKSKNGAGITLEKLLDSSGSDFCFPDYKGIELKAIRDFSDASFDLFNSTPDSNQVFSTQWLAEKFGYPDKDFKDKNVFKGDIFGNKMNKIGLFNYYKLKVDHENRKIVLEIYDYKKVLINSDVYWDFEDVKKKLELKLTKLALVTTNKIYSKGNYYYLYKNIKCYTLKSFDVFLKLIENGVVYVTFKTGIFKSGIHIGNFHDHGTSFKISKKNLELLFNKVY